MLKRTLNHFKVQKSIKLYAIYKVGHLINFLLSKIIKSITKREIKKKHTVYVTFHGDLFFWCSTRYIYVYCRFDKFHQLCIFPFLVEFKLKFNYQRKIYRFNDNVLCHGYESIAKTLHCISLTLTFYLLWRTLTFCNSEKKRSPCLFYQTFFFLIPSRVYN
jgi:hypothetical protein